MDTLFLILEACGSTAAPQLGVGLQILPNEWQLFKTQPEVLQHCTAWKQSLAKQESGHLLLRYETMQETKLALIWTAKENKESTILKHFENQKGNALAGRVWILVCISLELMQEVILCKNSLNVNKNNQ